MESSTISNQIQNLPMPLAQLVKRSLNAKNATDRHQNAFFLGEAALKLAAAARIGVWMEHAYNLQSPIIPKLEKLVRPSAGTWLEILRELDETLAKQVHASQLPLGAVVGRAAREPHPTPELNALVQAAQEEGILKDNAGKFRGLIGFFTVWVAYRNRVHGHGAVRQKAFYDRFSQLLLHATLEALASPAFLGDYQLAVAGRGEKGEVRWQSLMGLGSLPLQENIAAQLPAVELEADELFLVAKNALIRLQPLVMFSGEDEQERVGFLNETAIREKSSADGVATSAVTRVEFLDYGNGSPFKLADAQRKLGVFLGRLRGKEALSQEEMEALEREETTEPKTPEEEMGTGTYMGEFELLDKLGQGGMGEVYRARQRSMRRIVALKVLPRDSGQDVTAMERFRREIQALGRCEHPNVVKIYAPGEDRGRVFYAMEYVEGADLGRVNRTLSSWKKSGASLDGQHLKAAISGGGGSQPLTSAGSDSMDLPMTLLEPPPTFERKGDFYRKLASLFAEVADGLSHIHSQGIIHRDIKPENIMLTSEGNRLVIMDLGLAKFTDASRSVTADKSHALGTLAYMAPEQLQMQHLQVDHRADLYGLGVVLYELATGKRFWQEGTAEQLMKQIMVDDPVPPRKADPALPRDLATIISKATARNPEHRYATAAELASDLAAFSELRPIKAHPPSLVHRSGLFIRRHAVLTTALVSSLAALAVMTTVVLTWKNMQTDPSGVRTQWCAQAVDRRGVLACAFPVSAAGQKRRNTTYRFTSLHQKVVKVERLNGSGQLTDGNIWGGNQETAQWEFEYNRDGTVSSLVERTATGKFLQKWIYPDLTRRDRVDQSGNPLRQVKRLAWGVEATEGAQYTREKLTYDDRGCLKSERYQNVYGAPQRNHNLDWGYEYERDENCLPLATYPLDHQGIRSTDRDGVAKYKYSYDPSGNIHSVRCLGLHDELVFPKSNVASDVYEYDEYGNKVSVRYLGVDEKMILAKTGYAGWKAKYDEKGNQTETWFFGVDEKPTLFTGGYAGWKGKYDEKGKQIERGFFGVDEKPTLLTDGYSGWKAKYDEKGNQTENWFYGVDGKLTLKKDGYAGWKAKYDEKGNQTENWFYGVDEKLTLQREGFAGWKVKYDESENLMEKWFFGVDEKPTLVTAGHAGWRAKYDEKGNQIERGFLGVDGKPTVLTDGYSVWKAKYDEKGNQIEKCFLGVDEKPTVLTNGYSVWKAKYDEKGNQTENWFYGVDEKLTVVKDGHAGWKAKYDEKGNPMEKWFCGVDEKLTPLKDGQAGWRAKYDAKGNLMEKWFYGVDEKLTRLPEGYAGWKSKFNERGNEVEIWFFGVDEKLTLQSGGYAGWKSKFDERGNEVETWFYGVDEKLTLQEGGYAGWKARYDEKANLLENWIYGVDEKLMLLKDGYAGWKGKYDAKGNQIEKWYFGVDEKMTPLKEGQAGWKAKYDAKGNQTEKWYFGVDEKLTLLKDGYAGWKSRFDDRGKEVETWYFGVDEKLTLLPEGYAGWTSKFDERGNEVETWFFGVDEKWTLRSGGYAGWKAKYDQIGNKLEQVYLGLDGSSILHQDGFSKQVIQYDVRGNKIECAYFGPDGKLALHKNGYARTRSTFDPRGNETERAYFGADGKPKLNKEKIAGWKKEFNSAGNPVREEFFGADGKIIDNAEGVGWIQYTYHPNENLQSAKYFSANGKMIKEIQYSLLGEEIK